MKKSKLIPLIIFLFIVIFFGLLYIMKDKLAGFAIEKSFQVMENAVAGSLPEAVSTDSAHTLFSNAVSKIKSDEAGKEDLQGLLLTFQSSFKDKQLDSTEIATILEGLKKIGEE